MQYVHNNCIIHNLCHVVEMQGKETQKGKVQILNITIFVSLSLPLVSDSMV